MRIARLEVIWLKVPLVTPFRTSFGTAHDKDTFLVRLETTDGTVGWAECAAELDPLYSAEWLDGCEQVLRRELVPRLLALGDRLTAGRVATALEPVTGNYMAKHVIETAVLDAELRRRAGPSGTISGPSRSASRPGSRWGSWTRSPSCSTMSSATLTRATCGSSSRSSRAGTSQLCVPSANASGTRSCSRSTPMLPTPWPTRPSSPASTLRPAPHRAAPPDRRHPRPCSPRHLISTPVCLDESIESARDAATAIALDACRVINIKPARVGGYLEARRIHDIAVANGIPVWCGGMLETGVGRAPNVAPAALPGFVLPGDTSASDRYFRQDITAPFVLDQGHVAVPTGPGIGVDVLPDALAEVTISRPTSTSPADPHAWPGPRLRLPWRPKTRTHGMESQPLPPMSTS